MATEEGSKLEETDGSSRQLGGGEGSLEEVRTRWWKLSKWSFACSEMTPQQRYALRYQMNR